MERTIATSVRRGEDGNARQIGWSDKHANTSLPKTTSTQTENIHTTRGYFGQFNRNRGAFIEQELLESKYLDRLSMER